MNDNNGCIRYPVDLEKYESLGGIIVVANLKTGTTQEVFRNLSYKNNYCKNIARRIISLEWLDDSRLAFETIDGVYLYNKETKQTQTLFTFESTQSPGAQSRPTIRSVQLPFVLFSDSSVVRVDTNKRIELISSDAQKGHFFTFK